MVSYQKGKNRDIKNEKTGTSKMRTLYLFLIISLTTMNIHAQPEKSRLFTWSQAKQLPDPEGFAGPYAGVSQESLIVAGGSNFPGGKRPWDNAVKGWYDDIYVLKSIDGTWMKVGKLPRPMGYGVALTYKNSVICVGGGDSKHCYSDVFSITLNDNKIKIKYLASLPEPLMNSCGVIEDNVLYVIGGITTPTGETLNNFWCLDLKKTGSSHHWKKLEDFPGQSRMLATAGAFEGSIYLFGGTHLYHEGNGLQRKYLQDCWKYSGHKWKSVAELPIPLVATPSPAYAWSSKLILFGGDDGYYAKKIFEIKDLHPGFRNEVLSYDVAGDKWSVTDHIPVIHKTDSAFNPHNSVYAPVTTPLVIWDHKIVIAGGEARPGVRSNRVLIATPKKD